MQKTIYYLPGRGGRLDTGLGQHLLERGYDVTGRSTVDEFNRLITMDDTTIGQTLGLTSAQHAFACNTH